MAFITDVAIEGLNGHSNLSFALQGRHCVFVGPNGTGKSTALQIIAYALGRQWKSLGTARFEKLHLSFDNGLSGFISRDACLNFSRTGAGNTRFARISRTLAQTDYYEAFLESDLSKNAVRQEFASLLNYPEVELRTAQNFF